MRAGEADAPSPNASTPAMSTCSSNASEPGITVEGSGFVDEQAPRVAGEPRHQASGLEKRPNFHAFNTGHCIFCRQSLSVHERATGETCGAARCKNRALRANLRAQAQLQSTLRTRARARLDSVARSQAIAAHEQLAIGILPSNDRRQANLPAKRIGRFRDRLMQIISQAAAIRSSTDGGDETTDDSVAAEEFSTPEQAILGNACAVCRGDCCSQGGDHGFIQVETIIDYMARHPQRRPRDILHDYLSQLGKKTYDGSCVYHTASGCSLPREMRSHICNGFLCKGLNQILFQLPNAEDTRVFVVATADRDIVRTAIVDKDQRTLYNDCSGKSKDGIASIPSENLLSQRPGKDSRELERD